jgi:hypothetical protein
MSASTRHLEASGTQDTIDVVGRPLSDGAAAPPLDDELLAHDRLLISPMRL